MAIELGRRNNPNEFIETTTFQMAWQRHMALNILTEEVKKSTDIKSSTTYKYRRLLIKFREVSGMIFISIKRKTFGFVVLAIILCLLVASIYSTVRIAQNENKYQSVLGMARMFEDTYFIAYISDEEAQTEKQNIEVFDIGKGKVISRAPLNSDIQNDVFNYVKAIKSLYTKVIPFPEKGYVIRVPFDPPMNINLKLLNDVGIKSLDSVFIILSDKEAPIILLLDTQRRPYFYTFNASIQPLLDYIKLNPEEKAMEEPTDAETNVETEITN